MSGRKEVEQEWRGFCDRLYDLGIDMLDLDPSTQSADGAADCLHYVLMSLRGAIDFRMDGFYPQWPHVTRWDALTRGAQPLAPNLDNSIVTAELDGTKTYRLSITTDTIDQLNCSIHAGIYGEPDFKHQWGNLTLDELMEEDGWVHIILSGKKHDGNWIEMPPQVKLLFLRLYYFDWSKGAPPTVLLTCLDPEIPKPITTSAPDFAKALLSTTEWLRKNSIHEYHFLHNFLARTNGEKNVIFPAQNEEAGPPAYSYNGGEFDLDPDQALIVEFTPPDAKYWSIQWHRLPWGDCADFKNTITSLNFTQLHRDADGAVRVVIAHDDPGVQNWLNTQKQRNGVMWCRWFWSRTGSANPTVKLVKFADIQSHLPPNTPRFDAEAREAQLAIRRCHLGRRY